MVTHWRFTAGVLALLVLNAGCLAQPHSGNSADSWPSPNNSLTPGAVTPRCTYPRDPDERDVTQKTKRTVKRWYRYNGPSGLEHVEYDHRIPFSLCGSNGPENIWPQPADDVDQSAFVHNHKDELEAYVARQVRSGRWTLKRAQDVFRGDWRDAWCDYIRDPASAC